MTAPRNYGLISTQADLSRLVEKLAAYDDPIGFDIETGYTGDDRLKGALHPEYGFIVGFSISGDPSWARYIPLRHDLAVNLNPDEALASLAPLSGRFVAHNAKFERRFLRQAGHDLQFLSDTMIEAYVISGWPSNALKSLTKAVFGHDQAEIDTLFPKITAKQKKSLRFNTLELTPDVISYACEDAAWCLGLHAKHHPIVRDNFIYKLEMSLQTLICEMEERGVMWDWGHLTRAADEVEKFMDLLQREIMADLTALTGVPTMINMGSPKQIQTVLFDKLGMVGAKRTKSGAYSTDAVSLASLSTRYPVVKKILQWKELKTLLTRYLSKWPREYSYAPDGRAHSNHMQAGVGTGRFAVDDPPYQQTPKKYHYALDSGASFDLNFRLAVRAAPGHYLLHYDYSQVELRAIAGAAQEPTLLEAFAKGIDVHIATAGLMLNVPREQVTSDMRDIGKTMNFALMYQMGAGSLADRLAISRERARELYDSYFSSYSAIAAFVERAKVEGKRNGYAKTHFGRKYTIWELQSSDPRIYSKGERVAVNAPIQGWAADYMKIAMVRARKALVDAGLYSGDARVFIVMNNHDALTLEVHESIPPQVVIDALLPAVTFPVAGFPQIRADWAVGERWGSMKALQLDEQGQIIAELGEVVDDDPFAQLEDEEGEAVSIPVALDLSLLPATPPQQTLSAPSTPEPTYDPTPPQPFVAGPPQTFVLEIAAMPDQHQIDRFVKLLTSRPGTNTIVLRTPSGDLPWEAWPTSVNATDSPTLSLIFGTARMYQETVDAASVLEGMTL